MVKREWSEQQKEFIIAHYKSMTYQDIAKQLNVPKKAIQIFCLRNGLSKKITELPKINDKIYRLTINKIYQEFEFGQNVTFVICSCECGKKDIRVRLTRLRAGFIKSCGCWKAEQARQTCINKNTTHNMSYTQLYSIWGSMLSRCNSLDERFYKYYRGKGVQVCEQWKVFENFKNWSLNNGYQENLTIDRIDVNGNYEPYNCRWTTPEEQMNNKSNNRRLTAFGETKTITQWLKDERCSVKTSTTILYRIGCGYSPEQALTIINIQDGVKNI